MQERLAEWWESLNVFCPKGFPLRLFSRYSFFSVYGFLQRYTSATQYEGESFPFWTTGQKVIKFKQKVTLLCLEILQTFEATHFWAPRSAHLAALNDAVYRCSSNLRCNYFLFKYFVCLNKGSTIKKAKKNNSAFPDHIVWRGNYFPPRSLRLSLFDDVFFSVHLSLCTLICTYY